MTSTSPPPTPSIESEPDAECPLGPIWYHGDSERMRLRRLSRPGGLLRLGVAISRAGQASSPHLSTPTHWWRDGDDTWLAAALPDGQRLDLEPPPRPTWSRAVDAITPLALSLRDAHRHQMVHAHLAPWNTFFDPNAHTLRATDFGTWAAESLPANPWIAPEMTVETPTPTPSTDIYGLTRLLVALGLSLDEAGRRRPNFETLPAYAIATLNRGLDPSPKKRPQTIDEWLAGLSFEQPTPSSSSSTADHAIERGRVQHPEIFDHPQRGKGLRFHFMTRDRDEPIGFFLYRRQNPSLFAGLARIWDGASLSLEAPREIQTSDGRNFLSAGPDTLAVLERHWPVTISNVQKAGRCPSRILVDLRDPGSISYHLPFGGLVHAFLEALTEAPEMSFEEALEAELPPRRLDLLAAGVDDHQLNDLVEDARRHFLHIQQGTAHRSGDQAEVTRFSSRFGLEGRADLVTSDDQGLDIIELKSGKPWHDHADQVQGYGLLWRALADEYRLNLSGHLLYSKQGTLKPVALDDGDEQNLLDSRNQLVTRFRGFVDPGVDAFAPAFNDHPSLCRDNACRFRRDRCRAQTAVLGLGEGAQNADRWRGVDDPLATLAKSYHRHLSTLIERERWEEYAQLGAIFDPSRENTRVADGRAAPGLSLSGEVGSQRATLRGQGLHIFRPGDRILLHRRQSDIQPIIKATVLDIDGPQSLTLRLRSAELSNGLLQGDWIADKTPARIGYRAAHQALYHLVANAPLPLLRAVLGDQPEPSEQSESALLADLSQSTQTRLAALNDSQRRAVETALRSQPATLIQGPPGTGKTTVIAHLALLFAQQGKRILLSALTNTAVDNMLLKIVEVAQRFDVEPPPLLRLGIANRSPELRRAIEDAGLDATDHFSDDLGKKTNSLNGLDERLADVQIVAATTHRALSHPVTRHFAGQQSQPPFDIALIDEASQLSEPMALAPIIRAERFVLVGDHRQLPPIIKSERALSAFLGEDLDDGADLQRIGVAGLDRSLFERLADHYPPVMLTTQYRMNRAIMAFPALTFYDDALTAHPSVEDHAIDASSIDAPLPPLQSSSPVVFSHIEGQEIGRTNPDEARALIDTAFQLAGLSDLSIGIISPFRAQVHLLRRLAADQWSDTPPMIDTVERFQGREKDVILFSLVKTDHPGDFLSDRRRFNVTLTRAKKKLILFGDRRCLTKNPIFRDWLDDPHTTIQSWTTDPS